MSVSAKACSDGSMCGIGNADCTKTATIAFDYGTRGGLSVHTYSVACQSCAVELVNALAFVTHSAGGDKIKLMVKRAKRSAPP